MRFPDTIIQPPGIDPGQPGQCVRVPSFFLKSGQVVKICGESGVGKSYLLSLILGLADLNGLPKDARRRNQIVVDCGLDGGQHSGLTYIYIPQFSSVRRELTIKKECLHVWKKALDGLTEEEKERLLGGGTTLEDRFHRLSQLLRLENLANKRIGELSGGTLKRFSLMLRLPFRANVLVLDEPDTGLDQSTAQDIFSDIQKNRLFDGEIPALLVVSHSNNLPLHQKIELLKVSEQEAATGGPDEGPALSGVGLDDRSEFETQKNNPKKQDALPKPALEGHIFLWWWNRLLDFWKQSELFDRWIKPSVREFIHQCSVLWRLENMVLFLFAPISIFLVLRLIADSEDMQKQGIETFAKYSFFAVIASAWLGLQLYSKTAVLEAQVFREDYWWIAGLCGGRRRNLKPYLTSLWLGLMMTMAFTCVVQSILGTIIFGYHLIPGFGDKETAHFFGDTGTFLCFFASSFYGSMLGLALGAIVAAVNLSRVPGFKPGGNRILACVIKFIHFILSPIFKPRRKPNLAFVNLLVPLVMLTHIVYSPIYLEGKAYGEYAKDKLETKTRLARINPCAAFSGQIEKLYCSVRNSMDSDPTSIFNKSNPRENYLRFVWIILVALAGFAGLGYILIAPEVRRE